MKYWRKPLDFDEVKIPHGQVIIIDDRCKGCGFCVEYCPKDVLAMSARFNKKGYHPPEVVEGKSGECVNCNLCEMICPDFAIFSQALADDTSAPTASPDDEASPRKKASQHDAVSGSDDAAAAR